MTSAKSRFPVASFDPRLIETLLQAARGETIKFTFETLSKARAFQMRLHTLRSKMRQESDARYEICCRATTSLRNADGSYFIHGQSQEGSKQLWVLPRDHQYSEAFDKAGVKMPAATSLEADPLDLIESPQENKHEG